MGSRDLRRIFVIDSETWEVLDGKQPPGIPWAAVATNGTLRFTIGEGPNDDRYIRQFVPDEGFSEADKIACPASNDCWLATAQGWLFHYSDAAHRALPEDTDPAFAARITFRPPDAGVPAFVPDAPPPDDSGLPGEVGQLGGALAEAQATLPETRVPVPLLSHLRSRLLHGSTLELRFHLAVRARVRLLAKRRRRVVASTRMRILQAGDRRLLLRLSPKSWPTKLDLQTHALAPLPTQSTRGAATTTVGTGAVVLPRTRPFEGTGALP